MIDQVAEIEFNEPMTSGTFLMGLKAPEITEEAKPGQFVMIRAASGFDPLLRRPFSICGTEEPGILLVLYRVVGRATDLMARTKKGERLEVLGPLGRGFHPSENIKRAILVAGGIGIAPLIFTARTRNRIGRGDDFLIGYRTSLEQLPLERFELTFSRIFVSTDDGSYGHHGTVTQLFESHLFGYGERIPPILACGPLPMLKEIAATALDRDIPCWISMEVSMACGLGACQGCAVPARLKDRAYLHVCKDGPVFAVESIDWARF